MQQLGYRAQCALRMAGLHSVAVAPEAADGDKNGQDGRRRQAAAAQVGDRIANDLSLGCTVEGVLAHL
jgi:hypothetical protein